MRGNFKRAIVLGLVFSTFFIFNTESVYAQQTATAVEWGEYTDCPTMGFNARITRQHPEESCMLPEQDDFRYDWDSEQLRDDIRLLRPNILRFPGGTPANFWNWYSESRSVIGEDGTLQDLEICEASYLGRSNSSNIGCTGEELDMTAQWYDSIAIKTTVTVESYLNAMAQFRSEGIDVEEMFVLNMIDPFYYLGSPHLDYVTQGASQEDVRDSIKNNVIRKVVHQLDYLLEKKCESCDEVDDLVHFELGNELFLQRYGKYFPRMECFDMIEDSLCISCHPDIEFYSDICEEIIPEIRQRFSNAKISLCASRNILQEPWNQVLLDRFNNQDDLQIDAVVYHFYPKTFHPDSLDVPRCLGENGDYDIDKALHYQQAHMDRLFDQKQVEIFNGTGLDIWVTEFNIYDYSERCIAAFSEYGEEDFIFDSANWLHTLSVFSLVNHFVGYRSETEDPWMDNSKSSPFTKLCMHLFYGGSHEAAVRDDRQLSGAGIAMNTIIELMQEADSMKQLMVAPEEHIQMDFHGDWSTNIPEGEVLQLHHDLTFSDHTDEIVNRETLDGFGWLFHSGEEKKALLVNLRTEAVEMNVSNIKSMLGDVEYTIYSVPQEELTSTIEFGLESSFIVQESAETSADYITLPAYSFAIIKDIPVVSLPNSIAEFNAGLLRAFPNPVNSELTISLDKSFGDVQIELLDIAGRLIYSESSQGLSDLQVDVSSFAEGTYFLHARGEYSEEILKIQVSK